MYFSNLKKDLEALKNGSRGIEEINRQQINLSDHARSILLQDMDVFFHQLNIEPGSGVIDSAVINHIFCNFWKDADASVYLSCEKKREQLDGILSGLEKSRRKQAIAPLIEDHRKNIEEQVRRDLSKRGTSFSIRVNKKNLENLGRETFPDWNENLKKPTLGLYCDKVGNYLKAVIEEYARKPYFEREAIFCRETLLTIQKAIRRGAMLKITTRRRYVQYVKPYTVRGDTEQLYHYLAGYLSYGSEENWCPGSIRLSSITDCEMLWDFSDMDAEQKAELEASIRKKGIQFLSDMAQRELPQKIVVKFTEEGKGMYHRMLHLRPMYSGRPEELVYEFFCTQRQIENYFFKFGHNVKILEPQELADKFLRRYESAVKQYK